MTEDHRGGQTADRKMGAEHEGNTDRRPLTADRGDPAAVGGQPSVVILISADAEWRAVMALFPEAEQQTSPLGAWFVARLPARRDIGLEGRGVIFFHGGWGKIAAAASTQYAIDRWAPELLVNLGTCGGFAGEVERGAILLVERTIVYDIIEQMGDFEAHIAHYTTELDLTWLGSDLPAPVRRTLLVSGDRDLLVEEIPLLKSRYRAVAGDWESGAIAFVAARNGTRCLILRGVSDLVDGQGSEAYGNLEYFAASAAQIMAQLVDMLPGWIERAYANA